MSDGGAAKVKIKSRIVAEAVSISAQGAELEPKLVHATQKGAEKKQNLRHIAE